MSERLRILSERLKASGEGDGTHEDRPLSRRERLGVGCGVLVIGLIVVLFAIAFFAGTLFDRLWLDSLGLVSLFDTRFFGPLELFVGSAVGVFVVVAASVLIAFRAAPDGAKRIDAINLESSADIESLMQVIDGVARLPSRRVIVLTLLGAAALIALIAGAATSGNWQTIALFTHQVDPASLGPVATDPIFGQSPSFYFFDLPALRVLADYAGGILDGAIILTAIAYVVMARRTTAPAHRRFRAAHLGLLVGVRVAMGTLGFVMDAYGLAASHNGFPSGVGATDAAIRIGALDLMAILTIVVAVAVLVTAMLHRPVLAAGAIVVWIGAAVIGLGVIPLLYQRLSVAPNELVSEQQYIANDIAGTRQAFGLNAWTTANYAASPVLSAADLAADQTTFDNARLWDYRPLAATLDQLQTVRQYYDFTAVDIDRYTIGGAQRQVMLSPREMALDKNPSAVNWLNTHILYTHGYGLAMVPVNAVGADGLPELVIKDLPVTSNSGAPTVSQPRIYFGERPSDWAITGAQTDEFDYPAGQGGPDATTRWSGTNGIGLGSPLVRALAAFSLGDFNLLISDQITSSSQLLIHRSLADRLTRIAPFLSYDGDPYLVVTDSGRLVWVQDAYTTSGAYPMSATFNGDSLPGTSGFGGQTFNYMRNSVKVTVDAYDGTTNFYINDPSDPLIRAYANLYPALFKPLSDMPAELVTHLRVPEDLFDVQTRVYARYHVTDPSVFYKGDDVWTVPASGTNQAQVLPSEAYYVEMRLPGQTGPEYLLMQPMVPANRPNMIAWIAARNDGAQRGQVIVEQLPRDTSIFGPNQIEARIDQDPTISSQITLWDQSGSKVVRGNLLVIPVGNSFVYLEPIYLQSTSSAFPQFTKIVVATSAKTVWANTLAEALQNAVGGTVTPPGGGPTPTPGPGATPGPATTPAPGTSPGSETLPTDVNGLIQFADQHFRAAEAAMGAGDLELYGHEMSLVQQALNQLALLTGGASPSPGP